MTNQAVQMLAEIGAIHTALHRHANPTVAMEYVKQVKLQVHAQLTAEQHARLTMTLYAAVVEKHMTTSARQSQQVFQ